MERNYAIDFIKFFAILAVVIIHTIPKDSIIGLFVLDNFSRFAVPIFFASSGYLFGKKVVDNRKSIAYFKRYIWKIFKIYVCWFVFYTFYDVLKIFLKGFDVQQELMKYFDEFTLVNLLYYGKGTSGYQLWFLPALIWSIAILYVFFRLRNIKLLLLLSFVLNLIGLFGQSYSIFYEIPISTRDALFIGLFYTTLGFFFASNLTWNKSTQLSSKTSLYLFFFFSIIQVIEGYILEKILSGSNGEYFLSTIFLTASLFSYILSNPQLGKGMYITKIGRNSLGIYITHVLFIDMLDMSIKFLHLSHLADNLVWKLVETLLVFILAYILYSLVQYFKNVVIEK